MSELLDRFRELWKEATKDMTREDWARLETIKHNILTELAHHKYGNMVDEVDPRYDVFIGGWRCRLKNGLIRPIWNNEFLAWGEYKYGVKIE